MDPVTFADIIDAAVGLFENSTVTLIVFAMAAIGGFARLAVGVRRFMR